jgi:urease accessory protein
VSWRGRLELRYRRDAERCFAHDRHEGPLRVLQALYPEGPGVCHHVLVHPPGGIVGGDELDIDVQLDAGTHALITTPGATRFYRSAGAVGAQRARLRVGDGARLEWLPLEAIAYRGCQARNEVRFDLAAGASMIGWDLLALGLPAAGEAFDHGRFEQHIEWPGRWLERGHLDRRAARAGATRGAARGRPRARWQRALRRPERRHLADAAHGVAARAGAARRAGVHLVLGRARALAPARLADGPGAAAGVAHLSRHSPCPPQPGRKADAGVWTSDAALLPAWAAW